MKKWIAVIVSLILLTGCGSKRPEAVEEVPAQAETVTTAPAAEPEQEAAAPVNGEAAQDAYQQVLENYIQVLSMDSNAFNQNPEAYYNGDHMAVFNYHSGHKTEFLYAYCDIDRDGTDELLIGIDDPGDGMNPGYHGIVDVYSYDGENAVQLLDENILGSWRAGLTLHTDGSMHFTSAMGASDYTDVWYTLLGTYLVTGDPSDAPEVSNLNWQKMDISAAKNTGNSTGFDTIRERIAEACKITDYDSNSAFYDEQYSDLGPGIVWILTHRDDGVHTLNVFAVEFDIDNDSEKELCVARAVTPQHNVNVFAIYDSTPSGITAIYGDEVFSYLYPFEDWQLPVDWMEWEYLTM